MDLIRHHILLFAALAVFVIAVPARAQEDVTEQMTEMTETTVTEEQANNFYVNCMSTRDDRMTQETQNAMCACQSVKVMENMSVEEIRVMSSDLPDARMMYDKMLINVYAPCMSYPLQEIALTQCLESEELDLAGLNMPKDELCVCASQKTASWLVDFGPALMNQTLKKNPDMSDPLGPVIENRTFKSHTVEHISNCLTEAGGVNRADEQANEE